jgi:hypothetical protein
MLHGFMYLVAIIDWYSRSVLAWQLSNTLDGDFCLQALQQALAVGQPEIFNTDQGLQFTAHDFTNCLEAHNIRISMDGRGRALDNIFVERLWRTVKYEDIYLKEYATVPALDSGLNCYFPFYNTERPCARKGCQGKRTSGRIERFNNLLLGVQHGIRPGLDCRPGSTSDSGLQNGCGAATCLEPTADNDCECGNRLAGVIEGGWRTNVKFVSEFWRGHAGGRITVCLRRHVALSTATVTSVFGRITYERA